MNKEVLAKLALAKRRALLSDTKLKKEVVDKILSSSKDEEKEMQEQRAMYAKCGARLRSLLLAKKLIKEKTKK